MKKLNQIYHYTLFASIDFLNVKVINEKKIEESKSGLLDKFQYCDSNIELFSIAPPLVIALPTLR